MEYILGLGILGAGYLLQNNSNYEDKKKMLDVPKTKQPNGKNIYSSNRAYDIFQGEQRTADKLLEKSLYPQDTNVVTPGPTLPIIYNKVDYADKQLPIEFNSYTKYDDILLDTSEIKIEDKSYNEFKNNKQVPVSGGWNGISLTGDPINPNNFTHNNMVPFFGGAVKQNVDEFGTRGIFENFTGTVDSYQKKQEIGPIFQPQKNMSNVYGTGSLDGFMLDRYYVSNIRSSETPIEKIYVGPGLNQGYTSQPSGGFQQADAQDYAMPKTTDEIRVKTNPKISYYGRVISGEKINKPSKIGTVYKNRPDTFYVNEPDRYFTTTGAVIAQEQRPCIITKYTNRKTTELKTRKGSAAPVHGSVAQVRSKYKISDKITYTNDGPRNANSNGQWTLMGMLGLDNPKVPNDYGKTGIRLKDTNRVETGGKTVVINKKGLINKGEARNGQKTKITKKQTTINNTYNSNLSGNKKGIVYDPNDVARATIKETQVNNNHNGFLNIDGQKGIVYDPNDIARTTIKETNIDNNHTGFLNIDGQKGIVYDPNDVARTTIKETNIYNAHNGTLTGNDRGYVKDPRDKARVTMKQTTIKNKRKGNLAQQNGNYVKNEDKAKTTTRQTTMVGNVMGVATQTRNDAHSFLEVNIPENNRMTTSVEYFGDADGPDLGAYEVTDVNAPNTMRQFTCDTEHYGGAGNDGAAKPMSYEDIYNAEIKALRGVQDEGYTPGAMGPNQGMGANQINVTTTRIGDIQNQYLNERGVQSNKVYNSIPQITSCNITQDKETVPNEPIADRINPDILSAFRENPYTQSLGSWA